jgi:hypothetical protein
VVVRAAAHLLLVLVTTHASAFDFGAGGGVKGFAFLVGILPCENGVFIDFWWCFQPRVK